MTAAACSNHDFFNEDCDNCIKLVSRPATKDDFPSPTRLAAVAEGVPRLSIDASLVEEAIAAGRLRKQAETRKKSAVRRARDRLVKFLDDAVKGAGTLIVKKELLTRGEIKITEGAVVTGGNDVAGLRLLWEMIPEILQDHIGNCEQAREGFQRDADQADVIFHGAGAVEALIGTNASGAVKQGIVDRVFVDGELRHALDAADDTGEEGAALRVLRQQAGAEERSYTDKFMADYFGAVYCDAVDRGEQLPLLGFVVVGRNDWVFRPDPAEVCAGPGAISGESCAITLEIDHGPFEDALLLFTDFLSAFMNLYFRGDLKIHGDPILFPKIAELINAAQHDFHVDRVADEEEDIPF